MNKGENGNIKVKKELRFRIVLIFMVFWVVFRFLGERVGRLVRSMVLLIVVGIFKKWGIVGGMEFWVFFLLKGLVVFIGIG